MAEPAVTRLPADPRIVPTRFAGLHAAQALLPVICPGPYGHLAGASPEEIEAVMRRVWPGGRDAENRRARGAAHSPAAPRRLPGRVVAATVAGQRAG